MKYYNILLLSVFLLTSCEEKKAVLHLYTWDDYLNPDLITAFEEKYDCTLAIDIFVSVSLRPSCHPLALPRPIVLAAVRRCDDWSGP